MSTTQQHAEPTTVRVGRWHVTTNPRAFKALPSQVRMRHYSTHFRMGGEFTVSFCEWLSNVVDTTGKAAQPLLADQPMFYVDGRWVGLWPKWRLYANGTVAVIFLESACGGQAYTLKTAPLCLYCGFPAEPDGKCQGGEPCPAKTLREKKVTA